MNSTCRGLLAALTLGLALSVESSAFGQSATITLSAQKQYIRGYGGIAHAAWVGDLTAAERNLAFGNADGQLGFSILRIPVTDGNPDSVNVATAKAALAAGAIVFASPWNGAKTYTSADFAAYATHLNNFVTYMKGQGVDLYAISVQNEPDYGAQSGWGSWTASACHDFVSGYGASITTKLITCESFNYNKSYYDPILNDSATLAKVAILGTHLYGTNTNAYAYPLFDSKGAGKERWMTEHYTDSTTDGNSWPNALGVASELHNAMVTGQFNAYVWWTIKRSYGPINNGAVTKRGYCMGQWSKFVRPGFHRVDATANPASGLSLSAYQGNSSVVVVVVNTNNSTANLSLSIPGASASSFTKYTTSSSKSLKNDGTVSASNGSLSVTLDASSVTSLVGAMSGSGGAGGMGGGGGVSAAGAAGLGGSGNAAGDAGSASVGGSGGAASAGAANTGGVWVSGGGNVAGGAFAGTGTAPQTGGMSAGGGASTVGGTPGNGAVGDAGAEDAQGCSCRVSGRGPSAGALGYLGLLVLGARRRRAKPRVSATARS